MKTSLMVSITEDLKAWAKSVNVDFTYLYGSFFKCPDAWSPTMDIDIIVGMPSALPDAASRIDWIKELGLSIKRLGDSIRERYPDGFPAGNPEFDLTVVNQWQFGEMKSRDDFYGMLRDGKCLDLRSGEEVDVAKIRRLEVVLPQDWSEIFSWVWKERSHFASAVANAKSDPDSRVDWKESGRRMSQVCPAARDDGGGYNSERGRNAIISEALRSKRLADCATRLSRSAFGGGGEPVGLECRLLVSEIVLEQLQIQNSDSGPLDLLPALTPNYKPRTEFEQPIREWLKTIGHLKPVHQRLLWVYGPGCIGKTTMVRQCLHEAGVHPAPAVAGMSLYFASARQPIYGDFGLGILLGVAKESFPHDDYLFLETMWARGSWDQFLRNWLFIASKCQRRILIWLDQLEHAIPKEKIEETRLWSFLKRVYETDSSVFVIATSRDIVPRELGFQSPRCLQVGLRSGLSNDQVRSLFEESGVIQCSGITESGILEIARIERGKPGRIEHWIAYLRKHPAPREFEGADPIESALEEFSEEEMEIVAAVAVLNKATNRSVRTDYLADVLGTSSAVVNRMIGEIHIWFDFNGEPLKLDSGSPAGENPMHVSIHDDRFQGIFKFMRRSEERVRRLYSIARKCVGWLTGSYLDRCRSMDQGEVEARKCAVNACLIDGLLAEFADEAASILNVIDCQITPDRSELFRQGKAKVSYSLRKELMGHLTPDSRNDWLNTMQFAIASIRTGEPVEKVAELLDRAIGIAERVGKPVWHALGLRYRALNRQRRKDPVAELELELEKAIDLVRGVHGREAGAARGLCRSARGGIYLREASRVRPDGDREIRERLLESAKRDLRFGCNALEKAGDLRAARWFRLQLEQVSVIRQVFEHPERFPEVETIRTYAMEEALTLEPETRREARLFLCDLYLVYGDLTPAFDWAQRGLEIDGSEEMRLKFLFRLLMLGKENWVIGPDRELVSRQAQFDESNVLPLRRKSSGDSLFAVRDEIFDRIPAFLRKAGAPGNALAFQ